MSSIGKHARMTERRLQILKLMAKGYKDEQIARVMNISIANLKMQKSRLYNYLGVHTKKEALSVALEQCLINYTDFQTNKEKPRFPYIVRLEVKNEPQKTYRVDEELFSEIKEKVAPYLSMQAMSKLVRCVETGKIYKNARAANDWLMNEGLTNSYQAHFRIKRVCHGKQNIAYGYHWEFVGLMI